ncbi:MAG: type II toxin-antitoxin system VapC family toxin [Polaromonas sp.]|uniref:type II toxin-antitoxin system VapC family toxin n=1 Tax=Polaromonas sp. TaxID=1869339 RepID=UPI0025FD90D7|nr:type II toxin-antitoxin system VapC family toxin [Polaromonas sp.]MBI2727679.1 type II toxin-antitoxin system VapC family toxin [Polaromonas sp.]
MKAKAAKAAYATASLPTRVTARDGDARLMFDASALTKRYASEAGRERVLALFEAASELLVAAHCKTEVASALLRRRREGSLPASEFDRAWTAAQRDVADMTLVPLDVHVERFAFAAMEQGPLRGMDALHVGSALATRVDLFVTADRRQAQVARGMGLQTELIES